MYKSMQDARPCEAGGLLFGQVLAPQCKPSPFAAGQGSRVFTAERFLPLVNATSSECMFVSKADETVNAVLQAERANHSIVATVHSHLDGSFTPSWRDVVCAHGYQHMVHVIAVLRDDAWSLFAYRYTHSSCSFAAYPVPIES